MHGSTSRRLDEGLPKDAYKALKKDVVSPKPKNLLAHLGLIRKSYYDRRNLGIDGNRLGFNFSKAYYYYFSA